MSLRGVYEDSRDEVGHPYWVSDGEQSDWYDEFVNEMDSGSAVTCVPIGDGDELGVMAEQYELKVEDFLSYLIPSEFLRGMR